MLLQLPRFTCNLDFSFAPRRAAREKKIYENFFLYNKSGTSSVIFNSGIINTRDANIPCEYYGSPC